MANPIGELFAELFPQMSYEYARPTTITKGTDMNKYQIEREMDALRRQLARLEEKLQVQGKFEGLRDLEDGSVISFEYAFHAGGIFYSYAAIKVEGQWFTTGPRSPKGYTDDRFIEWLTEAYEVRDLRVRGKGRSLL